MTPFETIQKYYRQRDLDAREWKTKGEKVAGYFCDKVPEEMISAAGFFPFRISGNPFKGTEEADKYAEPFYEGFVRSMFNMILTGEYDFLDYIIIPHSRDTIVGLYGMLLEMRQLVPGLKLPEVYLFENLHTRFYITDIYNRERIQEFRKKLEEWSGKKISKKSLSRAIDIGNENRTLLRKIAELRMSDPPRISGVEALQLVGTSMFVQKEKHNQLLKEFLEGAGKLPARDGVRLFVAGSPLDNTQFYEIVELCGATIVAEDNCWGNRSFENPVKLSSDPMEAIIEKYMNKPPCAGTFPLSMKVDYTLRKALESKAQGAILLINEWDFAQSWAYPDQKKALEENGIPVICFKDQKYLISDTEREQQKNSIKMFIRNIGACVA